MLPFWLPFPECIRNDQRESYHGWKCQYLNVVILIFGSQWLPLLKWQYEEITFNEHLLCARGSAWHYLDELHNNPVKQEPIIFIWVMRKLRHRG